MVKQDQRVLEWMEILMLLITQQSFCILLGIQTRTQLLAPLQIACTCTMLNSILSQKKRSRKGASPCSRLCFSLVPYGLIDGDCYIHHYHHHCHSHMTCNQQRQAVKNQIIFSFLFFFFVSVEFFTCALGNYFRPSKKEQRKSDWKKS